LEFEEQFGTEESENCIKIKEIEQNFTGTKKMVFSDFGLLERILELNRKLKKTN
jgi:hypothetical protein